MDYKLIFLTGIIFLLVGYCRGAETPSDTTGTTNLPSEPTTSSATSSTTTPASNTTVSTPQSKTWVVVYKTTNDTCIAAQIISEFNFTYPVEIKANANLTTGDNIIIVPLDNSIEATGLCSESQSITLKWKENSVKIEFQLGEDKDFFDTLNVLNMTDQQNCSGNETVSTYKNDSTLIKTLVDISYKCDKVQQVNVTVFSRSSSAILSLSHTKFEASGKKKDDASGPPSLVLRPMPHDTTEGSNLLWFNASDPENVQDWKNQLDEFLEEYKKPRSENVQKCSYFSPPEPGKLCDVNIQYLYPCTTEMNYTLHGGICILFKLNKIYGWKPIMYNDTTKLPDKMPQQLKEDIQNKEGFHPNSVNTVWLRCEGENPADDEKIGPVLYEHYIGFPGFFFPYLNQEGYLSPIVSAYFGRPAKGVRINIVCKAWAHNLYNGSSESTGTVRFALRVD